ncbi:protein of unknown function [Candidatus Filomicrobium marinum]|uniref:Uncharacterized protein n=1 Tax=Candidatus Filomicrobium marinum TaxID=1608628 RepID=A0A0D6JG24_9HYPH|nr:protein of unknown function [Candidatus Filomicrobium marinum]CPR19124.1 protein of unknown function [Candidatus Filomicrobium marinum]
MVSPWVIAPEVAEHPGDQLIVVLVQSLGSGPVITDQL